jgi:hypothetical protein
MSTEISTQRAVSMNELASNGEHAVKTGMLPDHIKTGWQFAVIAATGHELGMQPMRAIRSLAMVKGKVVESADSQLARFKAAGGRSQFEVLDETKAVLHLVHPNGDKHTETFSLEDAKRAGLASNSNYSKFPKAMLRSRAITAGLKSIGWEGAVGAYDPDEIKSEEFPSTAVNATQPESVVVRPKFNDTLATETLLGKARILVSKATTVERLEKLRSTADERLADGTFTKDDHASLCQLIHGKLDILLNAQDNGTEHFDSAEIDAEAQAR